MESKLENALKLKRGAMVTALGSCENPALTGGNKYVLIKDAIPFYSSLHPSLPKSLCRKATDADFIIGDNQGREVRVSYCNFTWE